MKITGIKTMLAFPRYWRNWVFVRIYTDEGITGIGEATMHGNAKAVEAAIHEMEDYLIGKDPFGIERHWQAIYHGRRWRGGPVLNSALSGVEAGLWDIVGKALGVPVYKLLGGPYRNKVRAYANAWFHGARSNEELAEKAQAVIEGGYTALKWNPFGPRGTMTEGEATKYAARQVAAVREAVGDEVDVLIECSERLTPRGAIIAAKELEPFNPFFLEEVVPFENVKAMAKVAAASKVPIATGERLYNKFDFRRLLESQVADIIQPDLTHVGGILECKKVAAMAEAWYVTVAPHNSGGPISHAMAIQMAACTPNFLILENFINEEAIRREVVTIPLDVVEGYIAVPEAPGLGTDIIDRALEEYPYQPVEWDFAPSFRD